MILKLTNPNNFLKITKLYLPIIVTFLYLKFKHNKKDVSDMLGKNMGKIA